MTYLLTTEVVVQGATTSDQVRSQHDRSKLLIDLFTDMEGDLNPNAYTMLWKFVIIPQKLFQLTEWVHKLITLAQSDTQTTTRDLLEVYNKCLDKYEEFLLFLNGDSSRMQFMIFIQWV